MRRGLILAGMPPLPRPNPGPEPWPAGWSLSGSITLALALAALILLTAWWRTRSRRKAGANTPTETPATGPVLDDSIASWALRVREALAARFGPVWMARTTEEIAASDELAARLGADRLQDLTAFLRAADRVKFGGRAVPEPGWKARAERLVRAAEGPAAS